MEREMQKRVIYFLLVFNGINKVCIRIIILHLILFKHNHMPAQNIKFIERRVPKRNIGVPRIGAVTIKENGLLYYKGRHFEAFHCAELETNYRCLETQEFYLITDCSPSGEDTKLHAACQVMVDDDIRDYYWKKIRLSLE